MKGLTLAQEYFEQIGKPMIREHFASWTGRISAGLSGDGSDCFGFDDDISQDHDWGPGFCIWLTREDYSKIGSAMQAAYQELPKRFLGFERQESPWGAQRVGVIEIGQFFKTYTGLNRPPENLSEWRRIPEQNLAACTNGKVFYDPLGEFTQRRRVYLDFYPEDVRLKKIAFRCMLAAQSGQYNFSRLIKRSEPVAANLSLSQFVVHSTALWFLLNRKYMPFYKWSHRAVSTISVSGERFGRILTRLVKEKNDTEKILIIEEISSIIIAYLAEQGLSQITSDFLLDHGPCVQANIKDKELKTADIWVE